MRERMRFSRAVALMREAWWYSTLLGPRQVLAEPLGLALEVAYYAGGLDALGLAMASAETMHGDDCRVRALELQQEIAVRLAQLQAQQPDRIFSRASELVARRETAGEQTKRYRGTP